MGHSEVRRVLIVSWRTPWAATEASRGGTGLAVFSLRPPVGKNHELSNLTLADALGPNRGIVFQHQVDDATIMRIHLSDRRRFSALSCLLGHPQRQLAEVFIVHSMGVRPGQTITLVTAVQSGLIQAMPNTSSLDQRMVSTETAVLKNLMMTGKAG